MENIKLSFPIQVKENLLKLKKSLEIIKKLSKKSKKEKTIN